MASAPPLSPSVSETQASLSKSQPPTSVEILQPSLTDIGSVLADLSPKDMNAAMFRLTTLEKYALLKHHSKPSASYTFPTTYMGG